MRIIITFTFYFVAATFAFLQAQNNVTVVINELMADNETAVADNEGGFDDWIELHNTLNVPMDVSNYGLSDDINALGKFRLPDNTIIPESGYLIIWADDDQEQGPLHAQFRLSASGESIFLTDPQNNIIDQVEYPDLADDEAYAREPNGFGDFRIKAHTHGANNDTTTPTIDPLPAFITFSPNPVQDLSLIHI